MKRHVIDIKQYHIVFRLITTEVIFDLDLFHLKNVPQCTENSHSIIYEISS